MENFNIKDIPDLETFEKELKKYREEHNKLTLLLNITRNISREIKLERLLMLIMDEVKGVLECDRCTVFVLDREKNELWSRVAHGEKEIRFPSDMGIAGYVVTQGDILNIPDAYADKRFNPNIDKKTGYLTRNILTTPMRNRLGEIIGVFQALNKFNGSFSKDDEDLLNAISSIAATQIENAQLYEEQKKTFQSFVETLASTIDARDPLTAGHSKRIALIADEVAKVIDMNDQQREVLRTAAMLHDYGKIAVREAVLTKDGPLTDEEYHHIQRHPGYTKSILEKINFSRELRNVPLIAAAHHEKLDGSGYPSGLSDTEIPDMGKILAVADVFDALTSKRHYRDRMEFKKVMNILTEESGSHFDKVFVDAFKQIKVGTLISILEDENHNSLDDKDIVFLNNYNVTHLINALDLEEDSDKTDLVENFKYYYDRKYLIK